MLSSQNRVGMPNALIWPLAAWKHSSPCASFYSSLPRSRKCSQSLAFLPRKIALTVMVKITVNLTCRIWGEYAKSLLDILGTLPKHYLANNYLWTPSGTTTALTLRWRTCARSWTSTRGAPPSPPPGTDASRKSSAMASTRLAAALNYTVYRLYRYRIWREIG